jgi:hypothetical protein
MQRWRLTAWLSAAGLAAGFLTSFTVTPRYTSHAVFSLKARRAYSLLQFATSQVKTRTTLSRLIVTPNVDLYPEERAREPMEDVEDEMRPNFIFKELPLEDRAAALTQLNFTYRDPAKAQAALNQAIAFLTEAIRLKQTEISTSVPDPPSLPSRPDSPNRAVFAAAGLASGLLLALLVSQIAFAKFAVPLSIAGMLIGYGLTFVVTPRFKATIVLAIGDRTEDPGTPELHRQMVDLFGRTRSRILSNESISNTIQDPQVNLYNSMRDRITAETAIAQTRAAIRISMDDPVSPVIIPFQVTFTCSDGPVAVRLLNRMIAVIIQTQSEPQPAAAANREGEVEAQIGEPPASLAGWETRRRTPGLVNIEPLDLPTAVKEFPNPVVFALTGGFLGLLLTFPVRAASAA